MRTRERERGSRIVPVIPFGLNEWPDSQGHVHAVLPDHLNEFHQIFVSLEIELQKNMDRVA